MKKKLYQNKANEYQKLGNEIARLKSMTPTSGTINSDKTLLEMKRDHITDEKIQNQIIDIEILLLQLEENKNKKISDYEIGIKQYNENSKSSPFIIYQNIIQKISELKSLYSEDDQNFILLNETLSLFQGLSKIEDEEKRSKQKITLEGRLVSIMKVKKNILETITEINEELKKLNITNNINSSFDINYLSSLHFVKCIEIQMIESISKVKSNVTNKLWRYGY